MSRALELAVHTLAGFGDGAQDDFLQFLFFAGKAVSCWSNDPKLASGANKIAGHIDQSRFVLRFLGGVQAVSALLQLKGQAAPRIKVAQILCGLLGNAFELPSYVKMVAPELLNVDGARLGRMSTRMWLLSLLLELASLAKLRATAGPVNRLSLLALLANTVLALHWQMPPGSGFLSEPQLTTLGLLASGIGLLFAARRRFQALSLR